MGSSSRATTEPTNRIGSLFYVPLALLLILRNSLQGLGQKVTHEERATGRFLGVADFLLGNPTRLFFYEEFGV